MKALLLIIEFGVDEKAETTFRVVAPHQSPVSYNTTSDYMYGHCHIDGQIKIVPCAGRNYTK